jgi:hypothetical protein
MGADALDPVIPANQARARSYFEAVNKGEAAVAAFKRIFGLSPGALDDLLWRYASSLQAQRLRLKDIPDTSAQFKDYDKGDGPGLLLDAALHSCPAAPQAARLAARAATGRRPSGQPDGGSGGRSCANPVWRCGDGG